MWWATNKLHRSWLLALSAGCFVAGVALALLVRIPWWLGVVGIVPLIVCLVIRWVALVPAIAGFGVVLGLSFGSAHLGARGVYSQWIGQWVSIEGRVKEDTSRTPSGSTSVQLEAVSIKGTPLPGAVYVNIRGSPSIKRGDIVTVYGEVKEGFGSFPISVSALRVESVIRPIPGDVGRVVRDWFADEVREVIPDPQASLGIGFLTGQKSALPDDLSESLKIAGLTHIVVASGYNLTILVRLARKLFLKVSKFLSTIAASIMIILFVAMTGLSPSMTRAGLVSSMSLLAWYYGHAFHPFILLPVAAAITVMMQPSYVWGDLGWQLSFSAFAGVMILAPLLQRYFFGPKEPGVLRQILGETIAAHIITVPIIALSFGTVSNVAIVANLLVVPLVPLAMLLTFIAGVWSAIGVPFSFLIAEPTSWLLGYMVKVATFVSEIEWAQSELVVPAWAWLGYLALLVAACFWMWRATRLNFRGTESMM